MPSVELLTEALRTMSLRRARELSLRTSSPATASAHFGCSLAEGCEVFDLVTGLQGVIINAATVSYQIPASAK